MPLYEYDCPGCGRPFEKRVSMANADNTTCPNCGNSHPKRRISRISVGGSSSSGGYSAPVVASGGL